LVDLQEKIMIWAVIIILFLLMSRRSGTANPYANNTPATGSNGLQSLFTSGFLFGLNPGDTLALQLGNDAEFWQSTAGTPTTTVDGVTTETAAAVPGFSQNPFNVNWDGSVNSFSGGIPGLEGGVPLQNGQIAPPLADPSVPVTVPGAGFAT
jgi:hypothetical protein